MGGLIAMTLPAIGRADVLQSLTLVDITHQPNAAACARIAGYMTQDLPVFADPQDYVAFVKQNLPLGDVPEEVWQRFARNQLVQTPQGYTLHIDPYIVPGAKAALAAGIDLTEGLRQIDCPLALVAGEVSDLCGAAEIAALRALHPNFTVHVCPGAGHIPALADDAANGFIAGFIAGATRKKRGVMRRVAGFALELLGLAAVIVIAGVLALMLRLQQGPMNVDFLAAHVEKAFAQSQNGFVFDIDRTEMIWGRRSDPFALDMHNLRIRRSDDTPVAVIDRIKVVLSKRAMLLGRVVPKELYVYSPVLRVVRTVDGTLSLNVGRGRLENDAAIENAWDETAREEATPEQAQAQKEIIANLLAQMRDTSWQGAFGRLKRITIEDALLAYEDNVLGVVWRAVGAKIVLARHDDRLVADTIFRGSFNPGDAAAEPAFVRLRFDHDWNSGATTARAYFTGLNPADVAPDSEKLKMLSGFNLPLKGEAALLLDDKLNPSMMRFTVAGGEGLFNLLELYPEPVAVKRLLASGSYDIGHGEGIVDRLQLDFGGPTAEISARLSAAEDADGVPARRVEIKGDLNEMPMDDLHRYWSAKLAPDAQAWVTKHLGAGVAHKATVDMALLLGPEKAVTVEKLGGQIDFTGIDVDYFPPLKKVTGVDGRATYDADTFNIEVGKGALGDMRVDGGTVKIGNLKNAHAPGEHARIDIAVSLAGPLKTALEVIDSKPLSYPSSLGLDTAGVAGAADVDVTFAFPLHKALEIHEVAVTAKAKVEKAVLPAVAAGFGLSGGPFAVDLEKGRLRVKGEGRFGDAAIILDWQKNFTDMAAPAMQLDATLTAPAAMLPAFGVPEMLAPSGMLPARLALVERRDGTAMLKLDGDLTPLGFSVAALDVAKGENDPGALQLELAMKDQKPQALTRLSVDTPALTLDGRVDFAGGEQAAFKAATLSRLRFGRSDLQDVAVSVPAAGGYAVAAKGAVLDAAGMFRDDDTPNTDEDAARRSDPVTIDLAVDKLMTGENKALDAVRLKLIRNDLRRLEMLELDAVAGNKPLMVRYLPADGGKTLRFEAGNAGAALDILGITSAIRGGRLVIDGKPAVRPQEPLASARDMAGTAVLADFEVRNAPVLAKLLNAMSLSGILDLMNNKGLSFKKARARFNWVDRSPQTGADRTVRAIRLEDGQTSGASLGLMFEGGIDLWRKVYDLKGTIVPVSDINKILEKIPLLGDVLTAGGEGLIAATYTIEGPQKNPDVDVNPLSVLAPGVLRKIFFED